MVLPSAHIAMARERALFQNEVRPNWLQEGQEFLTCTCEPVCTNIQLTHARDLRQ